MNRALRHCCAALACALVAAVVPWAGPTVRPADAAPSWRQLPTNVHVDYQLGGSYDPPAGVRVVARDWWEGEPIEGGYSICYVNGFQTQDNIAGIDRPDERRNWPKRLVIRSIGEDPSWPGEYPIDIRTPRKRQRAARWVRQMTETCADKGFDAVEFDNLDTWTRYFDDGDRVIQRRHAVAYARLLTRDGHALGLAVGQKNTPQFRRKQSIDRIGFDFVVAEECGRYHECFRYTRVFGDRVLAIEYTSDAFARTCAELGDRIAVIRRDLHLATPASSGYVYENC